MVNGRSVMVVSVRTVRVYVYENGSQLRQGMKERVSHFFGEPVTLSCWQVLIDEKIELRL